jgi:dTMP kinase
MQRALNEPPPILGDRGLLIVFEGIDGAGKTTQVSTLAKRCEAVGLDAVVSKEPTEGPWGAKIRASATSGRLPAAEELEAFLKDRREHVAQVIQPGLDAGKVVIVDRYYFSTAAYQGVRGLDVESILQQNEAFAPQPDILAFLDLDVGLAMERIRKRGVPGSNTFEQEEDLRKSATIFRGIDRPYKLTVDASGTVDEIADKIGEHLFLKTLFDRLCQKRSYKTECEPEFCSFRISGACRWPRLGQLAPIDRKWPLPKL